MEKIRAAMHNGKKSQKTGKVIRPPHNDTDREKNPNVKPECVRNNLFYNWHDGVYTPEEQPGAMFFQEAELLFYETHYQATLDAQNERHRKARQYDRVKTMKNWLDSPRYSPTETILHVGNVDSGFACLDDMITMSAEYVDSLSEWSAKHGNCLSVLNFAIHADEFYVDNQTHEELPSSIHTHIRFVFDYVDEDGNKAVGTEKALEQAGYELPEPTEKMGRYNNRLMVFTRDFREKWQQIAISHGYDIETEPLPTKRRAKDKQTFVAEKIAEREAAKALELQNEAQQARQAAEQQRILNEEQAEENQAEKKRLDDEEIKLQSLKIGVKSKKAMLENNMRQFAEKTALLDKALADAEKLISDNEKLAEQIKDALERDKLLKETHTQEQRLNTVKDNRPNLEKRFGGANIIPQSYGGEEETDEYEI